MMSESLSYARVDEEGPVAKVLTTIVYNFLALGDGG